MTTQNNIARRIPIIYYQVSITRFKSWVTIWVWLSSVLQHLAMISSLEFTLIIRLNFQSDLIILDIYSFHMLKIVLPWNLDSKSWLKIVIQSLCSKLFLHGYRCTCSTVACFSQLPVIYFVNMYETYTTSMTQTAAAGMHIREQQSTSTWIADKALLQKHKIHVVLFGSNTNGKNY